MNLSFNFNIDIDPDRKIVIAKIYGIWKKETAIEYHEEYVRVAQPLLNDRWSKITNLTNWKSSYPEIIEILGEHIQWCHQNGAIYSVFAIDNPITLRQLKAMIDETNVADKVKIFGSFEEGDKFLRDNGF